MRGIDPFLSKLSLASQALLNMEVLTHVHPLLKNLLLNKADPINTLLQEDCNIFLPVLKILTKDQSVVSSVEWCKIPLLKEPLQIAAPRLLQWNRDQRILIDVEANAMLEKGAIAQVCHQKGELLSCIFLLGKRLRATDQ